MQSDVLRCFKADRSLAMFIDLFAFYSSHHVPPHVLPGPGEFPTIFQVLRGVAGTAMQVDQSTPRNWSSISICFGIIVRFSK